MPNWLNSLPSSFLIGSGNTKALKNRHVAYTYAGHFVSLLVTSDADPMVFQSDNLVLLTLPFLLSS